MIRIASILFVNLERSLFVSYSNLLRDILSLESITVPLDQMMLQQDASIDGNAIIIKAELSHDEQNRLRDIIGEHLVPRIEFH